MTDQAQLERHLPYDRLVFYARRLAREWGEPISVQPLAADAAMDRWGAARGRTVYFNRRGAPAHIVAHEVAHAIGPASEPEHGEQWRLRNAALLDRLAQLLG